MSNDNSNKGSSQEPPNKGDESSQLLTLRDQIDEIDVKIGALISERACCAQQVAAIKKEFSDGTPPVFYRPEREAQVLRRAMQRNQGPLNDEDYARLFREIMSACLALEAPTKVAFLGPEGTFTHQAAIKHFGHAASVVSFSAIDEVFREVEAGAAQFGVVPVENSTEGVVTHTLDSFMDSGATICGEVVLRIHHHLLVSGVTQVKNISRIYSHAQSFAQCRKWLDTHYPKAERIPLSSNSEAAKCLSNEWNAAAIASRAASDIYGLTILNEKIEDQPDNATRFLIIGNMHVKATNDDLNSGHDKTSIMVATKNLPGALHDILEPFHRWGIDLTRVETRPSKTGPWSYVFFIDFAGHQDHKAVKNALSDIEERASELKVLGSYPKGVL